MTRYEKCLLLLLLLFAVLQLTGITHTDSLLYLTIWVAAISYLLGGAGLFEDRTVFSTSFFVIAGICFATSLISIIYTYRLARGGLATALLIPNVILCIILGVYLYRHRKSPGALSALRGLWVRSAVLAGLAALLAFAPISFAPYRALARGLIRGDQELTNNLLMFDYGLAAQEALDREECAAAVADAHRAYRAGNRWLGADSLTQKWKISGAYSRLYEAYECLGNAQFGKREYAKALESFQTGNYYLVSGNHRRNPNEAPGPYWEEEKAWSLNHIADCYAQLRNFEASDSLYLQAMQLYKRVHPTPDVHLGYLTEDLAKSYAARNAPAQSTTVYRLIGRFLAKDTSQAAGKQRVANTLAIALNYIQQDSLQEARRELESLKFAPHDTTKHRFDAAAYLGIYFYKVGQYSAADKQVRIPLRFYVPRAQHHWESVAVYKLLLAKISLARGAYKEAQNLAGAAAVGVKAKMGATNSAYASAMGVIAAANKALGSYALAQQEFGQVLAICRQDEAAAGITLPETLAQLAELHITLDQPAEGKARIQEALKILLDGQPARLPSQTALVATAAYADYAAGNYAMATRQYRQVLAVNKRYGQAQSANAAAAWNGLGLVAAAQRQPGRADSLFQQALKLHEALFGRQHPLTGNVYLNYSWLRLQQGQPTEAAAFLAQSFRIAKAFFPADHDVFADLALAMGDCAQQQQQPGPAQAFYQQALRIYSRKLGTTHWKTRRAQQKVAQL